MDFRLFACTLIFYHLFTAGIAFFPKLTNLKCDEFDSKFATFKECQLKLRKRNTVGMNLYVKLFKIPVDNVTINMELLKKANGYRPFLYNIKTDFCKLMKYPTKFPFLKIIFDMLADVSNINHTCPYDHDIIIKNFVLNAEMFKLLPLPADDYMIRLRVYAYNHLKADVKAYFTLIEKGVLP